MNDEKLQRINNFAAKREQTCEQCGSVYQANYLLLSSPHDLSGGLCGDCKDNCVKEWERQQEAKRQMEVAQKRRSYRLTSGIPERFQARDFSNFITDRKGNLKTIYDRCFEYADAFPMRSVPAYASLVLYGANGLGKSHLAGAIGHRVLDRWQGEPMRQMVKFISEPDLLVGIQATYSFDQEEKQVRQSEDEIIRDCISVPLLILDDVAKEDRRDMAFVRRTLFRLIDGRYKANQPVVLTTNKEPEVLSRYLSVEDDCASYDRLIEMCGGKFLKLEGESYRRR